MYLNDKEEKIIEPLFDVLDIIAGKPVTLEWNDGSCAIATIDIVFEDMDEDENDENFEEYYSFVFRSISVTGKPPISVSGDNLFLVNYRNFPKSIELNGKNII